MLSHLCRRRIEDFLRHRGKQTDLVGSASIKRHGNGCKGLTEWHSWMMNVGRFPIWKKVGLARKVEVTSQYQPILSNYQWENHGQSNLANICMYMYIYIYINIIYIHTKSEEDCGFVDGLHSDCGFVDGLHFVDSDELWIQPLETWDSNSEFGILAWGCKPLTHGRTMENPTYPTWGLMSHG